LDFLREAARATPERPALDDGSRVWSYGELDREVGRWARGLTGSGMTPGRRVAVLLPEGPEQVLALHAVSRAGCVLAPLGVRLTPPELGLALGALDPVGVLVGEGTREVAREAASLAGLAPALLRVEELPGRPDRHAPGPWAGPRRSEASPSPAQEWAVLWTSGTGGRARGVALSFANFRASAAASRARLELGPEDRWHQSLSPAHVGGLALVTRAAFTGATLVTRGPFSAGGFNALVDAGLVTHASLVPTMLHRALEERGGRPCPPSLRCLLVGGARADADLVRRALAAGFHLALSYGLTEACSQVATAPPHEAREEPDLVGAPLDGVELSVDPGGEILVRGATVALGYLGTDQPLTDQEGRVHTGDLGELDARGRLRITGRRVDRIVTGGVNVDPDEVEGVLRLSAGVRDVSVVGVPDLEWGEVVGAAVVRQGGAYPDASELEALARARLTTAKIPRRMVFVEELPRNPNGKVDRAAVRALLRASAADAPPTPGGPVR